jgi:hypothetical protein
VLRGTHALLSLRPSPAPLPGALPGVGDSAELYLYTDTARATLCAPCLTT